MFIRLVIIFIILYTPISLAEPLKEGLTPQEQINLAINDWVINLAKVGFQLFRNDSN